MNERNKRECAECGSDNVVYNREDDETVCNDCGSVFAELAGSDEDSFDDLDAIPRKKKK